MGNSRDAGLTAGQVVSTKDGKLDMDAILKILPHREPFLFVDEVLQVEEDKRAVGTRKITGREYFFKGHFPGNPILPGVIMVEALAQLGGILMLNKQERIGRPAYFIGVNNVKFRKAVIPGDTLHLEIEVTRLRSRMVHLHGIVKVGEDLAAEADIAFGFGA